MLVLPLGLGTKLRRTPVVTLLVAFAWVAVFLFDQSSNRTMDGLFGAVAQSGVRDASRHLFVEYCRSRGGNQKECAKYSVFVWTGFPAKAGRTVASSKGLGSVTEVTAMLEENKKAEELKEKLSYCGSSKRCLLYKDILWRFLDAGQAEPAIFGQLKNYNSYHRAVLAYRKDLVTVCKTTYCLVKGNINGPSLAAAQLRHGGWAHLLSNLIAFLIFGIYVEQRTNRLLYLATLILGGTVGMAVHAYFFGSADTIALGGSANVSAVMGMFFVFFFKTRMRFLVWLPRKIYLGSTYFADIRYTFPLLFVLSDVSGGFDHGFATVLTGRVAHFAHLSGLLVGALVAVLITRWRRLPSPFIYECEMGDMLALEKSRDMAHILQRAGDMIKVNPDNVHAMEVAVTSFLRWSQVVPAERNAPLFNEGRQFLIANLHTVCAVNAKKGEMRYACKLLSQIPLYMPYRIYLNRLGQVNSLKLGDYALSQGHPLLALRLYDFFLSRFPLSVRIGGIENTAAQLLLSLPPSTDNINALASFLTYHPESLLAPRIGAFVSNNRARSA